MHNKPLALDGAFNFRDIGGYSTASGQSVRRSIVYRADTLHRLSDSDARVLEGLGIARVVDLRSDLELQRDGVGVFVEGRGIHVHAPLVEVSLSPFDSDIDWGQVDLRERYIEMLEVGTAALREVFESVAADRVPLVFHCTGGKDRTGVVAALLLRTLGVSDAVIEQDYSASERYLAPVISKHRGALEGEGLADDVIAYLCSSPASRMRYTLEQLDRRWGSTESYLLQAGVDRATQDALRDKLLA
ncbi:MAG: tyrosine-protein phosphatase [Deltaproteobacteria bacterium]|nr:tyrosine-protein phosphatase [Deltaproteobacteria bacterium]